MKWRWSGGGIEVEQEGDRGSERGEKLVLNKDREVRNREKKHKNEEERVEVYSKREIKLLSVRMSMPVIVVMSRSVSTIISVLVSASMVV